MHNHSKDSGGSRGVCWAPMNPPFWQQNTKDYMIGAMVGHNTSRFLYLVLLREDFTSHTFNLLHLELVHKLHAEVGVVNKSGCGFRILLEPHITNPIPQILDLPLKELLNSADIVILINMSDIVIDNLPEDSNMYIASVDSGMLCTLTYKILQ